MFYKIKYFFRRIYHFFLLFVLFLFLIGIGSAIYDAYFGEKANNKTIKEAEPRHITKNTPIKSKSVKKITSPKTIKAREDFKKYLQSTKEKTVLDAMWSKSFNDSPIISVSVLDNGGSRDGFAEYICMTLKGDYSSAFGNEKKIYIVIKNIKDLSRLGENFCKK